MATGYEKILALIDKKNAKVVSEVSPRINNGINSINSKTTLKPRGFRAAGLSVSGEQATSTSLVNENPEWIKEIIDLTVSGQLTEAVPVSVKPDYQHILGEGVWFCPDQEAANKKAPNLAFTPEELKVIIPLLTENKELAATLISARGILGGTTMDSSLDLPTAEPHNGQAGAEDRPEPGEDAPLDRDTSHHQDDGGTPSPREGLPSPGRHFVRIISVQGYLHNFPEYTGPRARLEMEIMDGPDVGKILVDNISLSHPQEPEGRRKRRLLITYKLGLVGKNDNEKKNIDWKSLQGISCRVDVVHKTYKGRVFPMVTDYQFAHKQ